MREWTVEGVDRSGAPRRIKVKAQDENGASTLAAQRGVNPPHSVYVDRVIEYAPEPAGDAAASQLRNDRTAEAAKAGKRLRAVDQILSVIGWLYLGLGVLLLVVALLRLTHDPSGIMYLIQGVVFAGISILFFGAGAAARMLAVMGECAAESSRRA
jgi:hypothetical protein